MEKALFICPELNMISKTENLIPAKTLLRFLLVLTKDSLLSLISKLSKVEINEAKTSVAKILILLLSKSDNAFIEFLEDRKVKNISIFVI